MLAQVERQCTPLNQESRARVNSAARFHAFIGRKLGATRSFGSVAF
jgi:hypothetical protein